MYVSGSGVAAFLSRYSTVDKDIVAEGDLNLRFDTTTNSDTIKVASILESNCMRQNVTEHTHVGGQSLDHKRH